MNRGRSSGRGKSGAADCAQAGAQGQNTQASEDKQEGAGNENLPDSRGNHRQQSTRGRGGRGRGRGGRGSDGNQVIAAENAPLA